MEILLALLLGLVIGFLLGVYVAGRIVGHRLKAAIQQGEIDRPTAQSLADLRKGSG